MVKTIPSKSVATKYKNNKAATAIKFILTFPVLKIVAVTYKPHNNVKTLEVPGANFKTLAKENKRNSAGVSSQRWITIEPKNIAIKIIKNIGEITMPKITHAIMIKYVIACFLFSNNNSIIFTLKAHTKQKEYFST